MELSKEHIEELYRFTKAHYVEWYDLQTELVDHLANDIEQIWLENPGLSFHQARDKAFSKFGIFGFMDLIGQKQGALEKKYWNLVWKIFKDYFKIPKIIITATLIIASFTLLHSISYKSEFVMVFVIGILISLLSISFTKHREIKKRQKETGKKWMFEQTVANLGGIYLVIQLPVQIFLRLDFNSLSTNQEILFSIFGVLFGLLCFIIIYVIPLRMEEIMQEHFPEYKLYRKA